MGYVIAFILSVVGAVFQFFTGLVNYALLGVSIVLSKFVLRVLVGIAFFTFFASKTQEIFSNFASAHIPGEIMTLLCMTGIAQGFNIVLSAYFVAIALRSVRRIVLGGD